MRCITECQVLLQLFERVEGRNVLRMDRNCCLSPFVAFSQDSLERRQRHSGCSVRDLPVHFRVVLFVLDVILIMIKFTLLKFRTMLVPNEIWLLTT